MPLIGIARFSSSPCGVTIFRASATAAAALENGVVSGGGVDCCADEVVPATTSIIQTHSDASSHLFNSQPLLWLSACSYNVHRILARYDQYREVGTRGQTGCSHCKQLLRSAFPQTVFEEHAAPSRKVLKSFARADHSFQTRRRFREQLALLPEFLSILPCYFYLIADGSSVLPLVMSRVGGDLHFQGVQDFAALRSESRRRRLSAGCSGCCSFRCRRW